MCPTNNGIEDTEYFLLLCPSFAVPRRYLLAGVFALLRPFGHASLQNDFLIQILLYGGQNFPNELNKNILPLTLQFIHTSGRFDYKHSYSVMSHKTKTTISHLSEFFCLFCLFFFFFCHLSFIRIFNVCLKLDTKRYLMSITHSITLVV